MTMSEIPSGTFSLYVTHIEAEGPLLKIWGQTDKEEASKIETIIQNFSVHFKNGIGSVTSDCLLIPNTICCAYHEDGYYRARICRIQPATNTVLVQFIDYGNVESVPFNQIRQHNDSTDGIMLQTLPPVANDFNLTDVLPFDLRWSSPIIEYIKNTLRYHEWPASVVSLDGKKRWLNLYFNGRRFCDFLKEAKMALPAQRNEMLEIIDTIPSNYHHHQSPNNNIHSSKQRNQQQQNNWRQTGQVSPSAKTQQSSSLPQLSSATPKSTEVNSQLVFTSRLIDKTSQVLVTVSHVDDGPLKFSIQLKDTQDELADLMRKINNYQVKKLSEPPITPGTVCIGRHSKDNVLRRAVMMAVTEQLDAKVFYIDYGDNEILKETDIYELPAEFINPPPFSLHFTLSDVRNLHVSQEMKNYFSEIVKNKTLMLHVRPLGTSTLIQHGSLFDNNGKNILEMMIEKYPYSVNTWPSVKLLTPSTREEVHVSYVEACSKFFVQLDKCTTNGQLDTVTKDVAESIKTANNVKQEDVKIGRKFLAQCATDSQWYRAEIISVQNNNNLVTVHYVDYGNDEVLPISSLRSLIFGSKSTKIPALAIPCVLSGYESAPFNEEVDYKFEELVLGKPLIIDVAEVRPNGSIIVNLYDTSTKPIVNISPMLRIATSTPSTNANLTDSIVPVTSMPAPVVSSSPIGTSIPSGRTAPIQSSGNDLNRSFDNPPADMPKKSWKDEQNEQQKRPINNQKQWQNGDQGRQNQGQRDGGRGGRDSWNQPDKNFSDRDSDTSSRSGGDGRRSQYDRDNNFNQRDQRREPRDTRRDYGDNQRNQNNSSWDKNSRSPQSSRDFKRPASRDFNNPPPRDFNNPLSRDVDNPPSRDFNNQSSRNFNNQPAKEFNNRPSRDFNNVPTNNTFAPVKITKDFKIPPPNITLGAVKSCLLVYITNPSDFYVQLCPDNSELDNLMEKIAKIYETGGYKLSESSIKVGASCVAQYSEDGRWYRGIIQSLDNSTSGATVKFIDYGNMEVVKYNNIKEIQEDISKLSTQAIHCKLLGPEENIHWNDNQINQFSALVEEEGLEAEFVGLDDKNGNYEILLRRVVNGVPSNNYINNDYAPRVDLMKVKDALKNKNRKGPINQTSKITNIQKIDYASPGDTWEKRHVDFGKTEAIFVSWYDNPESFFVQALSSEKEFRPMMDELQLAYVNEKPINDAYLKPGTAVIAIFNSDGALYRADIVKSNGSNGFIVKYVDFGNEGSVQKNQIFKVNKKFMKLPKQAVKCCLNILPMSNDKSWPQSAVQQIEKILDIEQLDCKFDRAESDDKYFVSLSNKGVDVIEEIVNKRFASYPVPVMPAKPDIIESLPSTLRQENVDISLLVGQTLRVNVSSVESVGRFFIQLPSAGASKQIIGDFMANKDPRMLALPNQLAVMQNQAIECFIKNAQSSSPVNQKLKGLIENKEIIINVEEIQNNRLAVKLYNNLGHKIKIADNEVDEIISMLCPMPVLSITNLVTASHIDNSKSIWLKKCNESDIDAELLQELYDFYSKSGTPLYPVIGKLCAGRSVDENWYRAKVLEINDDGAVVHFVDYGNTEQIHPDYLRELEPNFCLIPQLAIQVGLSVNVRGTDIEQKNILSPYLLDKEFTASLYSIHKNWIMEMETVPGKKLSETLKSLNVIVVEEVVKPIVVDPNEPKDMIVGGKYVVNVTSVENPAGFWIQRLKDVPAIDSLQVDLQNFSKGFKAIDGVPQENLICAAVYSGDEMWYRAEVIDADDDIVTVRFIDYGNTDTVSYPYNDKIKHLPAAMKVVPRYAIKCRLDLSPIDEYDWSETVCQRFDTLATNYDHLHAIVLAESSPLRIQLLDGTNDLADILIEENLAVKIQNNDEFVDEIIERELDPKSAFVSHINSPNEFWIQQEKFVRELELIADRFVVADMFPHLNNINEGQLCVAKFPEDGLWYRAKVLSRSDTGIKVNYIDYGNSAVSTEIREIPNDVSTIPPLSRKCYLPLPTGYDKWSDEACQEFTKMAGDGATIFHLEIINENSEISKVKLTHDGKDITDDLIKYCQPAVSIPANPVSLLDKISSNVLVSNVTSPGEFWVQAENKISEIDLMGVKLENASNFMPLNSFAEGTICAAKFPEDNLWYRAKIIYHSGNDTEVLYIDYGNSAVTNELRALPENMINIPAFSRQCALKLPANINCWSKEACEKFIELVADGETVFQCEQLDQVEKNNVRLSINGNDILNVLVPLCINTTLTSNKETVGNENFSYQHRSYSDDTSGVGGSVPSEASSIDIPLNYNIDPRRNSGLDDSYGTLNRTFPDDSFNISTSSTSNTQPDHLRSEVVEHCSNSYNVSGTFEVSASKSVETDISLINETIEPLQIASITEECVLSPASENGNSIMDETSGVYQSCTEDDASFVDESENHPIETEVNQENVPSPCVPSIDEPIDQEQGICVAEDEVIIVEDIAQEINVSEDPNVQIVIHEKIADESVDVNSDDDSSPAVSAKTSVETEEMN